MSWLEPPSEPCQHWYNNLTLSPCTWCGKWLEFNTPAPWGEDLSEGVKHYTSVVGGFA